MKLPPPDQRLPPRTALRAAALALAAAAAASILLAVGFGHAGEAWAAWTAATYVSWVVALAILVRRRLAQALLRLGPRPRHALGLVVLLAGLVAAAAAVGATHVLAGILAAAATTAVAVARGLTKLGETRPSTANSASKP